MGGDGFIFVVDGEGMVVSLGDNLFANSPGRHGIGVAIKTDGEIRVHLTQLCIAAIGQQIRQGSHGSRRKAIDGPLPRGALHPDIGHMVPPVIGLELNIGKIRERSQGPEVVPDVVDGSLFHLALLMGLRHIARYRDNLKG